MRRAIAALAIVGAAAVSAATGNGSVVANPPVTVIEVQSGAGTGAPMITNTTTSSFTVTIAADASCDPAVAWSVAGGNPFTLGPTASKAIQLACPAGQPAGIQRCLLHATDANNAPLVDLLAVCEYAAHRTLTPTPTTLDFGSVAVGDTAVLPLTLTNTAATTVTKLFVQTTELDGNFRLSIPCNPDAPSCTGGIAAVNNGESTTILVECTPQTAGALTTQLAVAADSSQDLAQTVTLQCAGIAASAPVIAISPAVVTIASPVEVIGATATSVVHLSNVGTGTLTINDVRTVDVDTGAAVDWTATASGKCTGAIPASCSLGAGEQVDIDLTFDPSVIGTRRASLLVSFHDTIDRTRSIPLDATGQGATLALVGPVQVLDLGMVPLTRMSQLDFELVNHGNRDTTAALAMMPMGPPFSLNPASAATVTPIANKAITASCMPSAAGAFSTMVTATSADAFMSLPVSVMVNCEGVTQLLYANPTALDLGEVRIAAGPVQHTVQLLSTGAPVTLTGAPQLATANQNVTLGAPSAQTTTTTFDVLIDPASEGDLGNQILVTDTNNDTLKIPLTGRVVNAAYIAPAMVDIGTFCVGQPTTSSNVSLASNGTATIALQAPALALSPSPFDLSFTTPTVYPQTIAPGGFATVAVTPQRQAAVTTISDSLVWTTDVEGKLTTPTAITATFIDSGGAIAPPVLDFGKVLVHLYEDDGQRVMIQNCNTTVLVLDPPAIKAPFSIDSPDFPTMLNPNETATFSVGFHPTTLAMFNSTLTITSDQLVGSLQVTLIGEGSDGGVVVGVDAGAGTPIDHTSFYACSCSSNDPRGGFPIVLAIALVSFRRRCGSSSARRTTARSPRASCRNAARSGSRRPGDDRKRTAGD